MSKILTNEIIPNLKVKVPDNMVCYTEPTEQDGAIIFPVGAVYISVTPENPSVHFGGTWEAFATGKTLIGIDPNDTDFNAALKTGGEKTHTLTVDEMPSHNHRSQLIRSSTEAANYGLTAGGAFAGRPIVAVDYTGIATNASGGGDAHNILQPYITVYMWRRVS